MSNRFNLRMVLFLTIKTLESNYLELVKSFNTYGPCITTKTQEELTNIKHCIIW